VLVVLVWRGRRPGRLAASGLVLLLAADLFASSFGTMQYQRNPNEHHALVGTPPQALWLQKNLGLQRYLVVRASPLPAPDDQITENLGMQFGLRNVSGVGGGILDFPDRLRFCALASMYRQMMNLAGVRYIFTEVKIKDPPFRILHTEERYTVYENPACLPPAFFVPYVTQVAGTDAALQAITQGRIDPSRVALIYETPPSITAVSTAQQAQVTEIVESVPGRWVIRTVADAPAQLVITDGFDPGWRCRIGGQPVPIFRTDDQFMSVAVPGGQQEVILEYAPSEFRLGAWVSIGGLLLTAVLAFMPWRRHSGARIKPRRRYSKMHHHAG